SRLEKQRSYSRTPRRWRDVNCNDVPDRRSMDHDKSKDRRSLALVSDEGERSSAPNICLKFLTGIGNSSSEALLVHAPERVEIFWTKLADRQGHADIVAATAEARSLRLTPAIFTVFLFHS